MGRRRVKDEPSSEPEPRLVVDGTPIAVHAGDTIGSAMMRAGILVTRTSRLGTPRGLFCGIGICYDCLVVADGRPNVRACLEPALPGGTVETQAH